MPEPMKPTISFYEAGGRVEVIIPGRPYTKNTHAGRQGYARKDGRYEKARTWEANAKTEIGILLQQAHREMPIFPQGVPVDISVSLYLRKGQRADLQNYFKSICDAMNKILYDDDRQITSISGTVTLTTTDRQRVELTVCKDEVIDERL